MRRDIAQRNVGPSNRHNGAVTTEQWAYLATIAGVTSTLLIAYAVVLNDPKRMEPSALVPRPWEVLPEKELRKLKKDLKRWGKGSLIAGAAGAVILVGALWLMLGAAMSYAIPLWLFALVGIPAPLAIMWMTFEVLSQTTIAKRIESFIRLKGYTLAPAQDATPHSEPQPDSSGPAPT